MKQLGDEKTWSKSSEFFQKEYIMNSFLANMKKPVVSLMHGFTREWTLRRAPLSRLTCFTLAVGGGVGLSMHIPFRIATETTSLGMPEVS